MHEVDNPRGGYHNEQAQRTDNVRHIIQQTQAFFGKELDELQMRLWVRALAPFTEEQIRVAAAEYTQEGRYAPKPVDLIERCKRYREHKRVVDGQAEQPWNPGDPETVKAWLWFIGHMAATGKNEQLAGAMQPVKIDVELQDRYLYIVNAEARRLNDPDAVPDEFKLDEVWQ
jgi:hypothetical protein